VLSPWDNRSVPTPQVTNLILHRASHALEVAFADGQNFRLPCEYLRVESPSAEVQGHGPGQKVLVAGKRDVNINAIEPVGHYGVLLRFDDGHATGIYSWTTLYTLGREHETRWANYLAALEAAGVSR
jgi:DUF971 family protein